jgi:hypothetical protein
VNPLDGLDPKELVALSDIDFQDTVRKHARAKVADAFLTIEDVMDSSDDDQARLIAAGKILNIAKVDDERQKVLPLGVSEEVMKIALAGFAQLASIARDTTTTAVLRDVTPARADPRPLLPDLSPLDVPLESKELPDEDETEGIGEKIPDES